MNSKKLWEDYAKQRMKSKKTLNNNGRNKKIWSSFR